MFGSWSDGITRTGGVCRGFKSDGMLDFVEFHLQVFREQGYVGADGFKSDGLLDCVEFHLQVFREQGYVGAVD